MRYFLKLAYDGTRFHGWQSQPNANTVQAVIEGALSTLFRREVGIIGAGRTDAGVHARQMYCHFDIDGEIFDPSSFLRSVNKLIGPSVAIYDLIPVSPNAHARFDAIERAYKYYITLSKDPFDRNFSHFLYRMPDVDKMNEAGKILCDNDDFTSFAKLHSDSKTNICDVRKAEWTYTPPTQKLVFKIVADRFLRNMVRAVVGTLLEVGLGKLTIDGFKKIIDSRDRSAAGVSMPAKGLFLERIEYPQDIFI